MNEIINKKNYISIVQNSIKQNFKIILALIFMIILFFAVTQFYFFNKNNQILQTSIKFNLAKTNNSSPDFKEIINQLSQEKNFYGILASLEKININFKEDDVLTANKVYISLLNKSNISNIYKSAIAIHGSYNLINKINKNNEVEIVYLINNLLSFVDTNLLSYEGFKHEILYLLSVVKQDNSDDTLISDETRNLYQQIQNNDKITPSIKERVKKIHEFQKYK